MNLSLFKFSVPALLLIFVQPQTANANRQHETLAAMPKLDRHLILNNYLYQRKKTCSAVTDSVFLRIDSNRHAYWAVRCAKQGNLYNKTAQKTGYHQHY